MSQPKTILCPECQSRSEVPAHEIGKFIECPVCKKLVKAEEDIKSNSSPQSDSDSDKLKLRIKKLEARLAKSKANSSAEIWARKADKLHQQNLSYQKEVVRLKKQLHKQDLKSQDQQVTSIEGLETLALRIDSGQKIVYANTPFCTHFSINKESIIGKDSSILRRVMDEHLFNAIKWPTKGDVSSNTVSDNKGRHFEVKVTLTEGGIDTIFQDVTNEQRFKKYVQRYVSMDLTKLSEEDLVTFKYPERRFMTVSFTDLRDFTALSETMKPEEVRSTMNAYLEDIIHAINSNDATVDKIVGDEVMALFGAPRYYEDHALRAIKTACDQMTNLKALQASFARFGKHMPDCGIGINSGEMVVGNMGCTARQDYTVLGSSVNLAARLCGAARRGEIIITESTLNSALTHLPTGWESTESTSHEENDQMEIRGKTEGIIPLPERLANKVIYIGPDIKNNPDKWEYRFTFLFSIKVKGVKTPLPIIAVINKNKRSTLKLDNKKIAKTKNERFFGKYRLIEKVGRGGMGEVWKAKDNFGNIVALKMLIAGDGASNKQLKRFKREAEIMAKLQHRNICRIYEVGVIEQRSYIAMEFIDGISLSQVLKYQGSFVSGRFQQTQNKNEGLIQTIMQEIQAEKLIRKPKKTKVVKDKERRYFILPIEHTLTMMIKCLDAIEYAHEHGILHRDIKPANIMIRPNGEPVLMDFGLAKMDTDTSEGMSLSISGQIVGTIEYMAPEQAQSSKMASEISDIYSMGAVLYQMLAGRRHFNSSGNILTDSNALQNHVPSKISSYNRKVDRALETITLKALRADPDERYASVESFMTDLVRYQSGLDIAAKNVSMIQVVYRLLQRNRLATILTLCFIAVFIVTFIASVMRLYLISKDLTITNNELETAQDKSNDLEEEITKLIKKNKVIDSQKKAAEEARFEAISQMNDVRNEKTSLENAKKLVDQNLIKTHQKLSDTEEQLKQTEQHTIAQAHFEKANEYIQRYNFSMAEKEIDLALTIRPELSQAILLKSYTLIKRHEFQEALTNLKNNSKHIEKNKAITRLKYLLNNVTKKNELVKKIKNATHIKDQKDFQDVAQFKHELAQTFYELKAYFFANPKYIFPKERFGLWKKRVQLSLGDDAKLTMLKDKQLSLDLSQSKPTSLGALKGLQLTQLITKDLGAEHCDSLNSNTLKQLDLTGAQLNNWSFLRGLKLEELKLVGSNIDSLDHLAQMRSLKSLNCSKTRLQKFQALHMLPIQKLDLSQIQNIDMSQFKQIRFSHLKKLNLSDTSIINLENILHWTSLRHLDLSFCPSLRSLQDLQKLKLDSINLEGTNVRLPAKLGKTKVLQ